jgi:hypothetical protein
MVKVVKADWNFFLDMHDPWEDTSGRNFYVILCWVLVLSALVAIGVAALAGAM